MRAKFVFDPCFSLKTAVKQLLTALITSLAERKSNQIKCICILCVFQDYIFKKGKKQQDYLVKYQTEKNFPAGIIICSKEA